MFGRPASLLKLTMATGVVRALTALATIGLNVVVARSYGAAYYATFAFALSTLMVLSLAARRGSDLFLSVEASKLVDLGQSLELLGAVSRSVLTWSVLLALLLFALAPYLQEWLRYPGLSGLLRSVCFVLPAYTGSYLFAALFKAIRLPLAACLQEGGGFNLLLLLLLFLPLSVWGLPTPMMLEGGIVAAGWLGALGGIMRLGQVVRSHRLAKPIFELVAGGRRRDSSGRAFAVIAFSAYFQSTVFVMLAAGVLLPEQLGQFLAAQQCAMAISFVLIVSNIVLTPHIGRLVAAGQHDDLQDLLRKSALASIVVVLPLIAICLAIPGTLLGLFGVEFKAGGWELRLLAIANAVNVISGSVGVLLRAAGRQDQLSRLALVSGLLAAFAIMALGRWLDPVSLALISATLLVGQNIWMLRIARQELGISILPDWRFTKDVLRGLLNGERA